MLGSLDLNLTKNAFYTVYGGPYRERCIEMFGVKLAPEVRGDADLECPIQDYSIPTKKNMNRALRELVPVLLSGRQVYIGCMGGKGRTGLFLAILAKCFGNENPVQLVRSLYFAHAVETVEQEDFVREYTAPLAVYARIWWARRKNRKAIGSLTTKLIVPADCL